jgi:hypothetical protein
VPEFGKCGVQPERFPDWKAASKIKGKREGEMVSERRANEPEDVLRKASEPADEVRLRQVELVRD